MVQDNIGFNAYGGSEGGRQGGELTGPRNDRHADL